MRDSTFPFSPHLWQAFISSLSNQCTMQISALKSCCTFVTLTNIEQIWYPCRCIYILEYLVVLHGLAFNMFCTKKFVSLCTEWYAYIFSLCTLFGAFIFLFIYWNGGHPSCFCRSFCSQPMISVFSTTLKNVTPSDSQTLPLIPVFSICFKMTPTPDVKDEASCNL